MISHYKALIFHKFEQNRKTVHPSSPATTSDELGRVMDNQVDQQRQTWFVNWQIRADINMNSALMKNREQN